MQLLSLIKVTPGAGHLKKMSVFRFLCQNEQHYKLIRRLGISIGLVLVHHVFVFHVLVHHVFVFHVLVHHVLVFHVLVHHELAQDVIFEFALVYRKNLTSNFSISCPSTTI